MGGACQKAQREPSARASFATAQPRRCSSKRRGSSPEFCTIVPDQYPATDSSMTSNVTRTCSEGCSERESARARIPTPPTGVALLRPQTAVLSIAGPPRGTPTSPNASAHLPSFSAFSTCTPVSPQSPRLAQTPYGASPVPVPHMQQQALVGSTSSVAVPTPELLPFNGSGATLTTARADFVCDNPAASTDWNGALPVSTRRIGDHCGLDDFGLGLQRFAIPRDQRSDSSRPRPHSINSIAFGLNNSSEPGTDPLVQHGFNSGGVLRTPQPPAMAAQSRYGSQRARLLQRMAETEALQRQLEAQSAQLRAEIAQLVETSSPHPSDIVQLDGSPSDGLCPPEQSEITSERGLTPSLKGSRRSYEGGTPRAHRGSGVTFSEGVVYWGDKGDGKPPTPEPTPHQLQQRKGDGDESDRSESMGSNDGQVQRDAMFAEITDLAQFRQLTKPMQEPELERQDTSSSVQTDTSDPSASEPSASERSASERSGSSPPPDSSHLFAPNPGSSASGCELGRSQQSQCSSVSSWGKGWCMPTNPSEANKIPAVHLSAQLFEPPELKASSSRSSSAVDSAGPSPEQPEHAPKVRRYTRRHKTLRFRIRTSVASQPSQQQDGLARLPSPPNSA